MSVDKQTINYYKRVREGKGNIGLFLDGLFFDIALFLLLFLIILRVTKISILATITACIITFSLDYLLRCYKSKKLEKYVLKELTGLRHELLIDKIIFKSSRERRKIIIQAVTKGDNKIYTPTKDDLVFTCDGEKVLIDMLTILPPKKATIEAVIPTIEYLSNKRINRSILACTTSFDEPSKALMKKSGFQIELLEQSALLESAMDLNIIILDSELKKALNEKISSSTISKRGFLIAATNIKNVKRFCIFGAFLFLLASFTPFRTYYYFASAACFISSLLIYLYNTRQENKDSAEI